MLFDFENEFAVKKRMVRVKKNIDRFFYADRLCKHK